MKEKTFDLKKFEVQSDVVLDITLKYALVGEVNNEKDNCILLLTSYSATHEDALDLIPDPELFDTSEYCFIIVNMIGNSASSSPSNAKKPFDGPRFPNVTIRDNVCAQHRLVTQELGITRLRLVMGYSMGALQTFEWGCQHSDMIDSILPICGAARVSRHNWLFLESAKAALQADQNFEGGDYKTLPEVGMDAFAKVYAAWAFSQDFFREELYKNLGLDSVEEVILFMKNYFGRREPNDLIAMIETWQSANIAYNHEHKGDFEAALRNINCKAIVMPGSTDLYFRVEDSENEVKHMPYAELRIIDSKLGHVVGSGMDPVGRHLIGLSMKDLLVT